MADSKEPEIEELTLTEKMLTAIDAISPLARYESLTRIQSIYEELTKRVAAERARAVQDMHVAGLSYGQIAEVIGFTRARAQQLVERAGATPKKGPTIDKSLQHLTKTGSNAIRDMIKRVTEAPTDG